MQKSNNIKYIVIATIIVASIAVFAAVGGKGGLSAVGGSASANISLVKKQKLKYPSETAGVLMWGQAFCVDAKIALASTSGVQYTPSSEEKLTREQIIALFDDVKIEEYFSGANYARIESGKKINYQKFVDDTQDKSSFEKFNCKFPIEQYTIINIEKIDKRIDIQTTKEGGLVEVLDIAKELQKYRTKDTPFEPAKTIDVNNSKYKCDLAAIDMQACYLNGMQVHPGTGKFVIVQTVRPEPGSAKDDKLSPDQDRLYEEFRGTYRAAGQPKIEENISITVGEPIPNEKFEIPSFAKNFITKNQ